jgi:CheY-like chemotaxis protein
MAKILIVDDEINIIKTLSSILQDEDHIVYAGKNGAEAVEFLRMTLPSWTYGSPMWTA